MQTLYYTLGGKGRGYIGRIGKVEWEKARKYPNRERLKGISRGSEMAKNGKEGFLMVADMGMEME